MLLAAADRGRIKQCQTRPGGGSALFVSPGRGAQGAGEGRGGVSGFPEFLAVVPLELELLSGLFKSGAR